ncbi:hypothetical protein JVT61DRAFT_1308 [Boletus reticuloceps]|uniref:Uncharacterized protein n=1 Tax=Boletus reticuloceps TaxID=495285 RepID=A0A8I2YUJ7_9AGAM|nr:hypothetical protein JVT61DRAFT_1308 [Boletus reticuloceps]
MHGVQEPSSPIIRYEWNVGLTDSYVLALATAWPWLEVLLINEEWGWNLQCGITPGGLVRLLQTCQSLLGLALALDTRGYTEPPSSEVLASFQSTLLPAFSVDILDSSIEAESMPAIDYLDILSKLNLTLTWAIVGTPLDPLDYNRSTTGFHSKGDRAAF